MAYVHSNMVAEPIMPTRGVGQPMSQEELERRRLLLAKYGLEGTLLDRGYELRQNRNQITSGIRDAARASIMKGAISAAM